MITKNAALVDRLIIYIAHGNSNTKESDLQKHYPHIMKKALQLWGCKEFMPYMHELVVLKSRLDRKGFTIDAMKEIIELIRAHNIIYPEYQPESTHQFW